MGALVTTPWWVVEIVTRKFYFEPYDMSHICVRSYPIRGLEGVVCDLLYMCCV